ncbi:MAG: redoxin family protein [Bacteroidia bacterium]|nr:redoxin family protein [Bacteroidia bacterium]
MKKTFFSLVAAALLSILWIQAPLHAQRQGNIETFTLPSEFGDSSVSLSDFQGKKAVVVIFTSYHCSWSVKYMDRLEQLYRQMKTRDVAFVAINSNDPTLEGELVRISPPSFPFLKDADQAIAKKFEATKNPEVFVLVPSGQSFKIVYHGKIDDNPLDETMVRHNFLQDAIDQLLKGERVEVKETPTSGCSIKGLEDEN